MIVGTEWLIEAEGCDRDRLRDESILRDVFARIIGDLGLKSIDSVWHKFEGEGGVTGMVVLTESHLTCHTYPEHNVATFNLYCCRTRPEWDWEANLKAALGARSVSFARIERGTNRNAAVPAAVLRASRPPVGFGQAKELNSREKLVKFGEVTIRERGRLPHWEKEDGIYFVTFRLGDSLPTKLLEKLDHEREQVEKVLLGLERKISQSEKRRLDWLFSEKVDEYLDKNYGECILRNPKVAKIVADALCHFDGKRYHLYAWCVMPNHVHVVFQAIQRNKLEEILHSWKSFTAHEINNTLGRTGEIWQREYYDHLIRNAKQLDSMIRYTLNNPAKARLGNWPWVEGYGKYRIANAL